MENNYGKFTIPIYLKLGFVVLFFLVTLCNCGSPSASSKPPEDISIFEPKPIPEPVPIEDFNNTELGKRIRQDYLNLIIANGAHVVSSISSVWIEVYYGTYNGSIPVMLGVTGSGYQGIAGTTDIDDVPFCYNSSQTIIIYNSGRFYELNDAYEHGLLTQDDLRDISDLHNKNTCPWRYNS